MNSDSQSRGNIMSHYKHMQHMSRTWSDMRQEGFSQCRMFVVKKLSVPKKQIQTQL